MAPACQIQTAYFLGVARNFVQTKWAGDRNPLAGMDPFSPAKETALLLGTKKLHPGFDQYFLPPKVSGT